MKKVLSLLIILLALLTSGCIREKVKVDKSKPLVVLGDSISTGYGGKKSYVEYLKESLELTIISLSENGATTAKGVERIKEVLEYEPSIVVVELGGNDLLRRKSIGEIEENLNIIINELSRKERVVFLVKFYPSKTILSFFIKGGKRQYDEMYGRLGVKKNIYVIDNMWDNVWRKEMIDNIHPNTKGYKIMEKNLKKSLAEVLDKENFKE